MHIRTWTHDLLHLKLPLYPLDCCMLHATSLCLLSQITLRERAPCWEVTLNWTYTQFVCSFHPTHTMSSHLHKVLFPSSSIKHSEQYKMGIGTKILNFFPDQKGPIPENDKNLNLPSPRVVFFFLWNGKVHRCSTIQFCFSNSVPATKQNGTKIRRERVKLWTFLHPM